MSIIRCPNCKRKISSKSLKCAYCGYQMTEDPYQKIMKFLSKWVFYTTLICVILSIFLLSNYIPALAFMIMILIFMGLAYKSIINRK